MVQMVKYSPLTLLLLLTVGGCTSTGVGSLKNETNDSISQKISTGHTTKAEVVSMLGHPTDTSFTDSGQEIIKYEYTKLTPRARNFIPYNIFSQVSDGRQRELVVLFSDSGVVRNFVMNETDIEKRWGILE